MDNIKIILYADENLYEKIFKRFTFIDENNNRFHYFNRNNSDVKHILSNQYINFSINNLNGYTNVSHVLIQKTFYRNRDLIKILRKFKLLNPHVKLLLIFDDDPYYYAMLLSLIAKEKLCSIAYNVDDIENWFNNDCILFNHDDLILKRITRKQRKEFLSN